MAYVANGMDYPDALAGSPAAGLAGMSGGPLLLVRDNDAPQVILDELARLKPHRIVVLGSTGSISASFESVLASYTS